MAESSHAESFCVDGDIKIVAGDAVAAAVSFLHAHTLDPGTTKEHVTSLTEEQRENIVKILNEWTKPRDDSNNDKLEPGVRATPDQVWEFIFCLDPGAVTTCFGRIETLLREKRYQQVSDSCTAILKQYPLETATILLQRGLARTLMGGQDKEAISDYLRAFLTDKDITMQVVRKKQQEYADSVKALMQTCIYSKCPTQTETKAHKQWLALTIDCCRFLLTFEPNNFSLQMTFVERLKTMHKTDRAINMLTETLDVLHLDLNPDADKLTEVLLRRGSCSLAKQHVDKAVADITAGLNAWADNSKTISGNNDHSNPDNEFELLQQHSESTIKIAKDIFGGKTSDLADLYVLLDKAASKLTAEDRFKSVTKLENIRSSIDLYRALLVLQPGSKDALFKLATCYAKLGKNKLAVKIFDKLLEDPHFAQDTAILAARATCYRELGNKAEAQKDYDALLRNNPRDVTLLCERAMVHMENDDVKSAVEDLQTACRINQKTVVSNLNKEPLVQRTRTRQVLFDYAKSLLQDAPLPNRFISAETSDENAIADNDTSSVTLGISQLLTKLNPADQSCHILMAHAMFHSGCTNDAETKLKKMLQDNTQGIDIHVIKLHLGIMKIFTKRRDEGMLAMVDVVTSKGDRVVSSLLRDIPISERAKLSDESHQYGIDLLQANRDSDTVKKAVHCFTIAILCCRGTDLVLEEPPSNCWLLLPEAKCLSGIRKKSEKMTNSAWSLATLTASSSNLLKPDFRFEPVKLFRLRRLKRRRLNGGTGVYRSYLARAECMAHLGDQRAAILDFSAAIEVNSLCVDGLCGRAFMRLALGDEAECINDVTLACDLDVHTVVAHIDALPDEARKLLLFWIDHRVVVLLLNYGYRSSERLNTGGSASTISMLDETICKPGEDVSKTSSLSSIHPPSPPYDVTPVNGAPNDDVTVQASDPPNKLHKSETSTRDLKEALLSLDAIDEAEENNRQGRSRGSNATTVTSLSTNDDVISGMERAEILHKAIGLGKLLITVDGSNTTWHGMYADILIVKGDYEEALRHLQIVMDLAPNDVTAIARAGLINVKMNRFAIACRLLSGLINVDQSGLVYVLKALDSGRQRRLAEEAFSFGDAFNSESKYATARDYYSLSILADSFVNMDKLRMRSRCHAKVGDTSKAVEDISEVIKELVRKPQATDYCTRASLYLLEGKEVQACRDYMKAIEIDKNKAIALIHVKPGRGILSEVFYRQAVACFGRRNYQGCSDMCDVALLVEEGNVDLRKLRARAKRELTKCVVQ